MKTILLAWAICLGCSPSAADEASFVTTRTLSLDTATGLACATVASCRRQGYQVAVAVTDRTVNPLVLRHDPLAGHHTIELAQRKAYSAAGFQASTIELQGGCMGALQNTERVLLIGGGVPTLATGHAYGAVGVSGPPAQKMMGDIDDRCARDRIGATQDALEFTE